MTTWQTLPSPSVVLSVNGLGLWLSADGNALGVSAGTPTGTTQTQFFYPATLAWGPVLALGPTGLGGTEFGAAAYSPIVGGKSLVMNILGGSGGNYISALDVTTGAVALYSYNIDQISVPSVDAAHGYVCQGDQLWFPSYPTAVGYNYVSSLTNISLIVLIDIATATPIGVIKANWAYSDQYRVFGGRFNQTVSRQMPPEGVWHSVLGVFDTKLGNPSVIVPSNVFSGAPSVNVTFINGVGPGSGATISIPYKDMATVSADGTLAPGTADTFQSGLLATVTSSTNNTVAAGAYVGHDASNVTRTPFDWTNELTGTSTVLAYPTPFTTAGAMSLGTASSDSAYILDSSGHFYRFSVGTLGPRSSIIV